MLVVTTTRCRYPSSSAVSFVIVVVVVCNVERYCAQPSCRDPPPSRSTLVPFAFSVQTWSHWQPLPRPVGLHLPPTDKMRTSPASSPAFLPVPRRRRRGNRKSQQSRRTQPPLIRLPTRPPTHPSSPVPDRPCCASAETSIGVISARTMFVFTCPSSFVCPVFSRRLFITGTLAATPPRTARVLVGLELGSSHAFGLGGAFSSTVIVSDIQPVFQSS